MTTASPSRIGSTSTKIAPASISSGGTDIKELALMTHEEYNLIPLWGLGNKKVGDAKVDHGDFLRLRGYRWFPAGGGYAMRCRPDGSRILMHREILGLEKGDTRQGDHINRDRLDNRRSNLRAVTHQMNGENVGSRGTSSDYRGVSALPNGLWRAVVNSKHLGCFEQEVHAAAAAAQYRQETMPGSIEDLDLLKMEVGNKIVQRKLTMDQVMLIRLAGLTTSLSQKALSEMVGLPTHGSIAPILKGLSYKEMFLHS